MVAIVEGQKSNKNDIMLWILALSLFIAGVVGNYHFASQPLYIRVIGLLIIAGATLWLAAKTNAGQIAVRYWNEAIIELRKVVWPTRKETVQTTIAVLAMIFAMALFLWLVDALLLRAVAKILY